MDYKQRYEEALERGKIWQEHLYEVGDNDYADELNYIFPELSESEDERIRKHIIEVIKNHFSGEDADKCIAYLEKQGQNPTWSEEDEKMYNIVFEEYKNRQYYSHPTLEDYDISGQILGWLKSLKDRVIPQQKSAWSEEDEERFQSCLNILQAQAKGFMGITETINTKWIKSLKNRIKGE